MRFTKMHELGADYVLLDLRDRPDIDRNALAVRICDRHAGVGARAALFLLPSDRADVRCCAIRADSSEETRCGVGLSAVSRYAFESGIVRKTVFTVETNAGVETPCVIPENGRIAGVRVDLGEPVIDAAAVPVRVEGRALGIVLCENGRTFSAAALRVGTPQTAVFLDRVSEADAKAFGPLIARDPLFPEGTDVTFFETVCKERIRALMWERTDGFSPCAKAGAAAAAVAGALTGKTGRRVEVEGPYGTLCVEWSQQDNHVYATGPAEPVFSGIWNE